VSLAPDADIFGPGRRALALARDAFGGRGFFVSARRLGADGSWSGPNQAACALVEEDALPLLGGLAGAKRAGANTVVCRMEGDIASVFACDMGAMVRVSFAAAESSQAREARVQALREVRQRSAAITGVVPTPMGEARGLDTLEFFAACRLALPETHLIADVEVLGPKLAQLCLSFGADTIVGSIGVERALCLGAAAASRDLTRDEAVLLLRASGFSPCERLPDGRVQPP